MAYYSNFHHSNHPNVRQPYSNQYRPNRRSDNGDRGDYSPNNRNNRQPMFGGDDGMMGGGNPNFSSPNVQTNTLWIGNVGFVIV